MKRSIVKYAVITYCFLCSLIASAQTRTHNVRPGDSFASIATKYGVSEQALRELNPALDDCYVGMTLSIPAIPDKEDSNNTIVSEHMMLLREAIAHYEADDYSRAVRILNKSIRMSPMGASYYYRGISHYNLGHWKNAVSDLNFASISSDLTSSQKEVAKAFLERSIAKREEQQARNKETWANVGKVVGGAVLVAGAVAGAVMLDNYMDSNTMSSTSYNTPNTDKPYGVMTDEALSAKGDKEMNQIFAATLLPGKVEEGAEYENYCQMVERLGQPRPTMNEWRAIQGAAIMQMKEEGYDIIAEQKEMIEQQLADNEQRRKEDKEDWFRHMGYDISTSSSSSSSSSSSRSSSSSSSYSSSRTSTRVTEQPKYDARQQYKTSGVYSDDYEYKKKVTLYSRNGDDAKVRFSNQDLYKKGAYYYVKIGNTYYAVNYSNWLRFNKSILYAHESLYFNL